ncbi:helix-turn-helix domain-containing protein [Laceyella putida]|uniref:Helix-turn-helix domain-containing protein n=1 Tax=Laceyella putida TaxID=110101 RepID=A0ABW2RNR5_9BACL
MKVYTPEEVADILRVNINSVYQWIKEGKLAHAKLGVRMIRISDDQLQDFFSRMSVKATYPSSRHPDDPHED